MGSTEDPTVSLNVYCETREGRHDPLFHDSMPVKNGFELRRFYCFRESGSVLSGQLAVRCRLLPKENSGAVTLQFGCHLRVIPTLSHCVLRVLQQHQFLQSSALPH